VSYLSSQKGDEMDVNLTAGRSCSIPPGWVESSQSSVKPNVKIKRDVHYGDRIFYWTVKSIAGSLVIVLALIGVFLASGSWPSIQAFGIKFLSASTWDPVMEVYGALPVIFGTLVSSFLACLIAAPLSLGIALFISELAPKRVATIVGFLVEMLAAIPSVVYGLWGAFVLAPFIRTVVAPPLIENLGWMPLFSGPAYGVGMITAALILAIMITPTISSISREVFRTIDRGQREGALALGATRWEMMRMSVIRSSRAGICGAIVLGLGRALGETMAVTMVIGNRNQVAWSIFAPGQTMASQIANEYAEAASQMHLSALTEIGLVLFGVSFVVNSIARFLVWNVTRVKKVK
jgi:phosphate transport system permease protein